MTLWVSRRRRIQSYFQRILQPEVQPCFRIHSNLFAFANGFNSGACTGSRGAADYGALSAAGYRADCGADCGTDSCRSGSLGALRRARIGVRVAFNQIALSAEENPVEL